MIPCREIKHMLTGPARTYACEQLLYEPGFGMLRYVVEREYDIRGRRLHPGDVTHGLYWENRPYTLYVWDLGERGGRLYYFNVADRVVLRSGEFVWRDLAIDVVISAEGSCEILDEHELPADLDAGLRSYIDQAVALIRKQHRDIIKNADELIRQCAR